MFRSVVHLAVVCGSVAGAALTAGAGPREQRPEPAQSTALLLPADGRIETRHLTLRTSATTEMAAPGSRVTLRVSVTPKPKMHVYAPEQKDVIPVTLVLASDPVIRPGALRLPESERYFFAPLQEAQRVYSQPFEIAQDVTIAQTRAVRERASRRETITISGRLRYQACDDTICYLPQDVPVVWTITLEPPG